MSMKDRLKELALTQALDRERHKWLRSPEPYDVARQDIHRVFALMKANLADAGNDSFSIEVDRLPAGHHYTVGSIPVDGVTFHVRCPETDSIQIVWLSILDNGVRTVVAHISRLVANDRGMRVHDDATYTLDYVRCGDVNKAVWKHKGEHFGIGDGSQLAIAIEDALLAQIKRHIEQR